MMRIDILTFSLTLVVGMYVSSFSLLRIMLVVGVLLDVLNKFEEIHFYL